MKRRNVILFAMVAAMLWGAVSLAGCDSGGAERRETMPTTAPDLVPTDPTASTDPTDPAQPSQPQDPTGPTETTDPTDPTIPDDPQDPTDPSVPDDPGPGPVDPPTPPQPDDPESAPLREARFLVTREDGTAARGAAVIATGSDGYQEYEPADENGLAVLKLPAGRYTVRLFLDGQHGEAQVEIADGPVEQAVQLKDQRKLYILLEVSGGYDCQPDELSDFSVLEDALKARYPEAIFLTSENRYDAQLRDGDALLSVTVFVENYRDPDGYFASEMWVNFTACQECVTAWDRDEGGEEIDIEYMDGNVCSVQIRNDYDYEYQDGVSVITESFYQIQQDWHLSRFTPMADAWSYGYQMDTVRSTSAEQRVKAPGAGMKTEAFQTDINSARYQNYLTYGQTLFPYVDLWISGAWNGEIEQLIAQQP